MVAVLDSAELRARLGRHGTPTSAILVTGTTMMVCILLLDVRAIAGLASDTEEAAGKALRDLALPEGVLVALIRRGDRTVVPRGSTMLRGGDRLTVLGDPDALRDLEERYEASS